MTASWACLNPALELAALLDAIEADLVALDRRIAAQLDVLLHHPAMLRLEGRWRGLHWLAGQMQPGGALRLRVLAVSWAELASDLQVGLADDVRPEGGGDRQRRDSAETSALYQKIHQTEFNMAGGVPFGLMVVDHEVRHQSGAATQDGGEAAVDDIGVLAALAGIAAGAFCPMVLAASPALLLPEMAADHAREFAPLAAAADPGAVFDLPVYARWRHLRDRDAARFLALALPRVLARPPWREEALPGAAIRYEEHAPSAAGRVWMSAAYAFAANVLRAVARYGWPADLRGVDTGRSGGGLVTGLACEPFALSARFSLPRVPLDMQLRETQERGIDGNRETGLVAAGMMPLVGLPFGEEPAFGACRSLYRAPPPGRGDANAAAGGTAAEALANSRLASHINAVLCASRFAHTIKVRGRDMVGRLPRAADIEGELRAWLMPYVNGSIGAGAELRAARPLLNASVDVIEQEARPGMFACRLRLQPYFQLDSLASTFTFETEFALGGGAAHPAGGAADA